MDSRVFVPTTLHTELTEYTSLVRVLRTARTLDLTSHLLQHAAQQQHNDPDTWTPWPLIDCPVPEWSLQDEIEQLAETVARAQTHDELHSDSDSDSLAPAATTHLVLHTAAVLVRILNLMADQRPSAPGSMQNRLWAMNWEDVTSLLAVGAVVHPTVIARAEKRLEHIYGPSTTKGRQPLGSSVRRHLTSPDSLGEVQIGHVSQGKILKTGIHTGGSIAYSSCTSPNAAEQTFVPVLLHRPKTIDGRPLQVLGPTKLKPGVNRAPSLIRTPTPTHNTPYLDISHPHRTSSTPCLIHLCYPAFLT
ncbi:hypothetical protein HD554DRAFT_1233510 [Boletus coccyginus]|nr:hypothetical protein HD554DRAFT_1233510 [Boletus coccyginus]